MQQLLALLRLALERGWTVGLLLIIFFGLALLGSTHGFPFPQITNDWAHAGLSFGVATLIVSIIAQLVRIAQSIYTNRRDAAGVRVAYIQDARANLELLNVDETTLLVGLLNQGRSRFEVRITDPTYELLRKGVLVEVRQHGGGVWVCDIHPGIAAIKRELIRGN
jgi:hypothetical protein